MRAPERLGQALRFPKAKADATRYQQSNLGRKGRPSFEAVRELLVLLRHGQEFVPYCIDRFGFGHAAEPVDFALILRYPLRDRRRQGLHCYTQRNVAVILLAGRGLCSRRHDSEGVNGCIEGDDHLGMPP
jgi:hypothetical protein